MTVDEIRARRAELDRQAGHLRVNSSTPLTEVIVQLEREHLYLECDHPNAYDMNTMGRDPGGRHCPDCGRSR